MSFNKYPSRSSARYNTQGYFVPATQLPANSPQINTSNVGNHEQMQSVQFNNPITSLSPQPGPSHEYTNNGNTFKNEPIEENVEVSDDQKSKAVNKPNDPDAAEDDSERPSWLKGKLSGVRKITNKERRRRQNQTLRRLLTPKNALMVLNEIDNTGENNFSVQPVLNSGQFYKANANTFCAALNANGSTYRGYGENKMSARNSAAEQAVRDLLLKKMNTTIINDMDSSTLIEDPSDEDQQMDEDDLPMIQLASFALHKLFTEWECQGHRVPQLRTPNCAISDLLSEAGVSGVTHTKPPKERRTQLPAEAGSMHPCMVLSHMRPGLTYHERAVEGDCPQNFLFTMEVDVDGVVYTGKASSKREARKIAARLACQATFGVRFEDQL